MENMEFNLTIELGGEVLEFFRKFKDIDQMEFPMYNPWALQLCSLGVLGMSHLDPDGIYTKDLQIYKKGVGDMMIEILKKNDDKNNIL